MSGMTYNRPVFEAYPQLRDALPWLQLADLPTRVEPLTALGANGWVKRDDISHAVYGGNKIRKLEFILADAIARGKDHVITFGATGTNHGVATAMLCQQLGLRCTVLLFEQPESQTVRDNLQRMENFGAERIFCGSLARTVLRYYGHPLRLSPRHYFLFAGGSNIAGTIGFVNAAFELRQQIELGQCPMPAKIFVPVGSAATLAGLTIGMALAGLKTEVVGIRVAPSHLGVIPTCTVATVHQLMKRTCKMLSRCGLSLPAIPGPNLIDSYYGEGYGVRSEAGDKATATFAACGITLDQTYTAKAAAAYLDAIAASTDVQLYWHTYNSRPAQDVNDLRPFGNGPR
ncbi:MAG TPA: hypothetical protein DIW43_18405 [Spongiibacteraceae bacterium]|mgnify:CR=1 FL=1|nr:hypothetical protein [Spongiibacteraceae bacterium]HCS29433.1 hypothetical protein [Spongiibacteraceae bacterium]|tara:strand:+ start:490 stop:1521 length:1032 start_codon:yes stop_codon:yes gene_type:complete